MRALWVLLLSGCELHWRPTAHVGRDGTVEGARAIRVTVDVDEKVSAKTKGVVTYRGGDRVDWLRFELPPLDGCRDYEARLVLTFKAPRPGLGVALRVVNATNDEHHAGARAKSRRELHFTTAPGTVHVAVYAPRPDDAAEYTLALDAEPAGIGTCHDFADPPDLVRPPGELAPVAPPIAQTLPRRYRIPVQIERWTNGFDAVLEVGERDGVHVGDRAVPLFGNAPVAESWLEVTSVGDARCIATPHNIPPAMFAKIWSAVLLPPGQLQLSLKPLPPVIGHVIKRTVIDGGLELTVDVGSSEGVRDDWRATLLGGTANVSARIVKVSPDQTIVLVSGPSLRAVEVSTVGFTGAPSRSAPARPSRRSAAGSERR